MNPGAGAERRLFDYRVRSGFHVEGDNERNRCGSLADVKDRYASLGVEALASTPEQFGAYIRAEAAKFSKVIRESGAKVD
jgi:hypothetical protein